MGRLGCRNPEAPRHLSKKSRAAHATSCGTGHYKNMNDIERDTTRYSISKYTCFIGQIHLSIDLSELFNTSLEQPNGRIQPK